ncbi:MAG: HIT domain-containing protein [Candidatus Parvarchaeota archaeon]|nr:HIT domain-containing protein [Candidatus Parvarchaeota archaeon]MCW1301886.1 HIT domain-containing protein [Candidatus Parvarchaeota archaeon]
MEERPCIFCSIASKSTKSYIVYEDDFLIGVLDINPASKGHTLLIPKKHYNSLYEMPQQDYIYLLSIARAIGYSLMLSQGPSGVDILYTKELLKGNYNPHALLHIIPRFDEDKVAYTWEPMKFDDAAFSETADSIRAVIEGIKNEGVPTADVKKDEQIQTQAPPSGSNTAGRDKEEKTVDRKPVAF